MKHKLKWFENRVGKRIYRDKNNCTCSDCKKGFEEGIVVGDKYHAYYLEMVQYDMEYNYQDKPFHKLKI